jgi:hypothetical protein
MNLNLAPKVIENKSVCLDKPPITVGEFKGYDVYIKCKEGNKYTLINIR